MKSTHLLQHRSSAQRGAAMLVGIIILVILALCVVVVAYYALTTKSSTGLQANTSEVSADDDLTSGKTNSELAVDRLILKAAFERDEIQRAAVAKILDDQPGDVGDQATSDTTVAEQSLSKLQNDFITEADRRLKALNASLKQSSQLEPSQKPNITATINNEITTVTGLKAKAAAETSQATLQADIASLNDEYVNFLLAYVQTPMLLWANDQTTIDNKINIFGGKFQERLNEASDSGNSIAEAQTYLNSYQASKSDATQATATALTAVLAIKPSSYEANKAVLKTYYSQLAGAHNEIKDALATADQLLPVVAAYK